MIHVEHLQGARHGREKKIVNSCPSITHGLALKFLLKQMN